MSLGKNTNKRNNDWERKRRVVLTEEENPPRNEWSPYKNLPIAPGLPDPRRSTCEDTIRGGEGMYFNLDEESISALIREDILFPQGILESRPTRDTCADIRKYDGKQCEVSFDLSKYSKIGEEVELEDDGLNGIETYFPDFESFNGYFPDFTAFNYKAERFDEGDWPEFDVIE